MKYVKSKIIKIFQIIFSLIAFKKEDSYSYYFYKLNKKISCNPDPDRTSISNGPLEGKDVIYEDQR